MLAAFQLRRGFYFIRMAITTMGRKHEKPDKIRAKDRKESIDGVSDEIPKLRGCPVPEPIQCSEKRPATTMDDGIMMECTNVACPFKDVPLHDSCFKDYEDHLVRTMGAMGSARGWTEAQRRSNLWEKKGQALVAKVGRCRCGHGTTRRDEDAYYAREKKKHQELLQANGVQAKKKVAKPKLPTLNFATLKGAPTFVQEERNHRIPVRRVPISYRKREHSASSTISHDDSFSVSSPYDQFTEQDLVPAPLPLRQTATYASAARQESSDQECDDPKDVYMDSGIEMKHDDSSGSSECSDLSKDRSPSVSPVSLHDTSAASLYSEMSKDLISPLETPKSSKGVWSRDELVEPTSDVLAYQRTVSPRIPKKEKRLVHPVLSILGNSDATGSAFHTPPISAAPKRQGKETRFCFAAWSPMFGSGFNLGESVLATRYLPAYHP